MHALLGRYLVGQVDDLINVKVKIALIGLEILTAAHAVAPIEIIR
jgi:hypothetical protein